jgi:putative membrane protein
MRPTPSRYELALLASMVLLLLWSAIRPHDYFTWFLDTAPIFLGVPVLIWL